MENKLKPLFLISASKLLSYYLPLDGVRIRSYSGLLHNLCKDALCLYELNWLQFENWTHKTPFAELVTQRRTKIVCQALQVTTYHPPMFIFQNKSKLKQTIFLF